MTATSDCAIDPEAYASLEEIADGDQEFMVSLLEQFLLDAERLVGALAPALATCDAQSLERAAHTLKSSSANVGAMLLSNLCEELRSIGLGGNLTEATDRVPLAEIEFSRARCELENRLEKLRG